MPGGRVTVASMLRLVESVRVMSPGDVVSVRAGRLSLSLGHGALVDRYTTSFDWDRRHAGARLDVSVPDAAGLSATAFTGNVVAPADLSAVRVDVRPLAPFAGDEPDGLGRFGSRARLGLEAAIDAAAPAGNARFDSVGDVVDPLRRPIVGGSIDLTWPLLDALPVQVAPWIAVSGLYGLSRDGARIPRFGAGFTGGLDVDVALFGVAVHGRGNVDAHGPAHRSGVFGTLYDVERVRALRGAAIEGGGITHVPAPGGVDGTALLEVSVLEAVRVGAEVHLDTAPGAGQLAAWAKVALGPVRIGARGLRRGVTSFRDALGYDDATFVIAEAAVALGGPFSAVGRYYRLPRFDAATSKPGADDDVYVGLSCDLFFAPPPPR